eukprot:scaffold266388_cov27-Tisochrysis_lutea.AAC.1
MARGPRRTGHRLTARRVKTRADAPLSGGDRASRASGFAGHDGAPPAASCACPECTGRGKETHTQTPADFPTPFSTGGTPSRAL